MVRLPARTKRNRVTIVFISVLTMIVVLEIGLRLFFGNMAIGELTQFNPEDGRCVGLHPGKSVAYTGWRTKMEPVIQDVNELGYRGPLRPEDKPDHVFRIAMVGDSYVYGQGVTVALSQGDIRQLQLAKAAMRAGMAILQKRMGVGEGDIEQVLLAGAFGNFIRRESALRIGLLPKVGVEKIHFIGNAASTGAEMMLLSGEMRDKSARLAEKIEYVEIAESKDFSEIYAECIMF